MECLTTNCNQLTHALALGEGIGMGRGKCGWGDPRGRGCSCGLRARLARAGDGWRVTSDMWMRPATELDSMREAVLTAAGRRVRWVPLKQTVCAPGRADRGESKDRGGA
jgi:hypothetical protein